MCDGRENRQQDQELHPTPARHYAGHLSTAAGLKGFLITGTISRNTHTLHGDQLIQERDTYAVGSSWRLAGSTRDFRSTKFSARCSQRTALACVQVYSSRDSCTGTGRPAPRGTTRGRPALLQAIPAPASSSSSANTVKSRPSSSSCRQGNKQHFYTCL